MDAQNARKIIYAQCSPITSRQTATRCPGVNPGTEPKPSRAEDSPATRIGRLLETELLNEKEVSQILKTPKGTLRRWRCAGEGPAFIKLGAGPKAAVRYHPLDIEKYVEAGRRYPIRAGNIGGLHGN